MSMNAQTSQMPSSKLSRPGAVKLRGLLAPGLTLSLILAGPIFAGPLRAEVRPAEIAAADRALGANAAAYHALQEGRGDDAVNLLRTSVPRLLCRG